MKKRNIVFILIFLGVFAANFFCITNTSDRSDLNSLMSFNLPSASADEGTATYIVVTWNDPAVGSSTTTSDGCPVGTKKTCVTISITTHVNCLSGGNQTCTAGTYTTVTTTCTDCV